MHLNLPLETLVQQLRNVLMQLSDEQFKQPVPILFNASIGQHVRHIIELFEELNEGSKTGLVNYDNRKRDYLLENSLESALGRLSDIPTLCAQANKPLALAGNYSVVDDETMLVQSNYYRELIYNIEHTVHHMALIRVAVNQISDIILPQEFGIAVSTIRHKKACVQ